MESKNLTRTEYLILLLAMTDIIMGVVAVATDIDFIDQAFSVLVLISGAWMLATATKSSWRAIQSKGWAKPLWPAVVLQHAGCLARIDLNGSDRVALRTAAAGIEDGVKQQ